MLLTPLEWFWLIYISAGIFIMAEAIVESWSWPEYSKGIKILGGILCVVTWPLIFFI